MRGKPLGISSTGYGISPKKQIDGFQEAKEVASSADALRRAAWTTAPPATWATGRVFASRTLKGGTVTNVVKGTSR